MGTWPANVLIIIMTLMIMGGSNGSTVGALKLMRVLTFFKGIYKNLREVLSPNSVVNMEISGKKITDATSGLRMIDRNIIELFASDYPDDYPEPETIVSLINKGYSVKEIPVIMNERQGGVSSISATKSVYYMIKVTLAILFVKLRGK